jgi:hypothetical protein
VLLDLVVPAAQGRPGATTYVGAALTLIAVALAASRPRVRPA